MRREYHSGEAAPGKLVRPDPPVQRFTDVVRRLVHTLDALGLGGNVHIAQLLARAGYRLSPRSVGRIRKETSPPEPMPISSRGPVPRASRPVHVFMADVTVIPSRFRLFHFHIAVVLDVFSRFPLAWKIFFLKPTSRSMARLLRSAVRRFGTPRYFLSDHGTEFTGRAFRRLTKRLGIRHRFSAIGNTGSIAIVERFWRSVKQSLRQRYPVPPLRLAELEQRLRFELLHYAHFRPHQSLAGATPAEIYLGKTPRSLGAIPPPRARPGQGPTVLPVRIVFSRQGASLSDPEAQRRLTLSDLRVATRSDSLASHLSMRARSRRGYRSHQADLAPPILVSNSHCLDTRYSKCVLRLSHGR